MKYVNISNEKQYMQGLRSFAPKEERELTVEETFLVKNSPRIKPVEEKRQFLDKEGTTFETEKNEIKQKKNKK
ncbi:MAG: hypothetical protein LBU27_06150 [Candidatus Peribacteria bacterium]|nr:hypothetical protein [Candidatus Peribacteria bacterium]